MMRGCSVSRRKRILQIRFRIAFLSFSVVFVLMLLILCSRNISKANENNCSVKYFTSIEVKSGDTLSSISHEHMDSHYSSEQEYMKEVMNSNHLDNADEIYVGQYLIIPYYVSIAE